MHAQLSKDLDLQFQNGSKPDELVHSGFNEINPVGSFGSEDILFVRLLLLFNTSDSLVKRSSSSSLSDDSDTITLESAKNTHLPTDIKELVQLLPVCSDDKGETFKEVKIANQSFLINTKELDFPLPDYAPRVVLMFH
jgi:hypothetical protein